MPTTSARVLRADPVSNLKLRKVCGVLPTASVQDVIDCMVANKTGCALVMQSEKLIGIFTERDFVSRVVAQGVDPATPVEKVMTVGPKTITSHASVHEAIALMESAGFRHLPVL